MFCIVINNASNFSKEVTREALLNAKVRLTRGQRLARHNRRISYTHKLIFNVSLYISDS